MNITIVGNKSKNRLNYYMWRSIIERSKTTSSSAPTEHTIKYIPDPYRKNLFHFIWKRWVRHLIKHRYRKNPILKESHYKVEDSGYKRLFLSSIPKSSDIIVLSYISAEGIGRLALEGIRKVNPRVKIVLFMHDSLDSFDKNYCNMIEDYSDKGVLDDVYSFDKSDCERYGFHYWEQIYTPPVDIPTDNLAPKYDIYFSGRDKGRFDMLYDIAHNIKDLGYTCLYRIPKSNEAHSKMESLLGDGLYSKIIPYEESVREMLSAKCILDICQDEQHGISWRIIEALYYNKKILTNNPSVVTNRYYNPNYIQYFERVDDIDYGWIWRDIEVEYNYQNDYSPIEFIKKITNL